MQDCTAERRQMESRSGRMWHTYSIDRRIVLKDANREEETDVESSKRISDSLERVVPVSKIRSPSLWSDLISA